MAQNQPTEITQHHNPVIFKTFLFTFGIGFAGMVLWVAYSFIFG